MGLQIRCYPLGGPTRAGRSTAKVRGFCLGPAFPDAERSVCMCSILADRRACFRQLFNYAQNVISRVSPAFGALRDSLGRCQFIAVGRARIFAYRR